MVQLRFLGATRIQRPKPFGASLAISARPRWRIQSITESIVTAADRETLIKANGASEKENTSGSLNSAIERRRWRRRDFLDNLAVSFGNFYLSIYCGFPRCGEAMAHQKKIPKKSPLPQKYEGLIFFRFVAVSFVCRVSQRWRSDCTRFPSRRDSHFPSNHSTLPSAPEAKRVFKGPIHYRVSIPLWLSKTR